MVKVLVSTFTDWIVASIGRERVVWADALGGPNNVAARSTVVPKAALINEFITSFLKSNCVVATTGYDNILAFSALHKCRRIPPVCIRRKYSDQV